MSPVVADSLTTGLVLRDFGFVVLIALAMGLGFHAFRRLIKGESNPDPEDDVTELEAMPSVPLPPPPASDLSNFTPPSGIPGPLPLPAPPPLPEESPGSTLNGRKYSTRKYGVDARHFTLWDFLICFAIVAIFLLPVITISSPEVQEKITETGTATAEASQDIVKQVFSLLAQIAVYGFLAMLIVTMIQWVGMRDPVRVFGLKNMRPVPALCWILAGSALAILSVMWISDLSATYAESLFNAVETQSAVKSFEKAESPAQIILLSISAVVLAPLFEELLFRGYLYGVLKRYSEPMFAACLSGAIFGLIHMTVPAVLPLWFFGIFLAFTYEATRSLWVPIGIHAIFNATSIVGIIQLKEVESAGAEAAAVMTSFLP